MNKAENNGAGTNTRYTVYISFLQGNISMSVKYYISKVFWSILITGTIFFISKDDNQVRMFYFNVFILISAILFPFSWYQIERTALKYTDEIFWVTGIFKDGVPKTYLLTLFVLVNFIVSIPFGLICIFNEIKKGRHKNNGLEEINKTKRKFKSR